MILDADAKLSIRHPQASKGHRTQLAKWLREQADKLEANGGTYAAGFTASYNPDHDGN